MTGERCGVPWPVCPDCDGQGLTVTLAVAACPRCLRRFDVAAVDPCPWPSSRVLLAGDGALAVCASHAAHPSARDLEAVDR